MPDEPHVVTITLPATTRHVALARATAASLAAELDFTLDEIDDLRIGVDELVTTLIEAEPASGTITLVFEVGDASFTMTGEVADPARSMEIDDLTARILAATVADFGVDEHSCWLEAGRTVG